MQQWIGVIAAALGTIVILAGVLWSGGQTQGNLMERLNRIEEIAVQWRQSHDQEHVREDTSEERQVDMLLDVRLRAVRNEERQNCTERILELLGGER